jgi:hypothetical protein
VFDADCTSIHALAFASRDIVVSGNAAAQLAFWDARVSCARPARTLVEGCFVLVFLLLRCFLFFCESF